MNFKIDLEGAWLNNVQISDKFKCIFAHVPKTAGSSIERSLLFDDRRQKTGKPVAGYTTALEYRQYFPEQFNEYFKFTFVRNPWDRLVSAFFWLHQSKSAGEISRVEALS